MTFTTKQRSDLSQNDVFQIQKQNISLKNEVQYLNEQLDWFKRQVFGKKSEKVVDPKKDDLEHYFPSMREWVLTKQEEEKNQTKSLKNIAAHTRRTKQKGKSSLKITKDLPVETTVLDIDEKEKVCQETGEKLTKIKEEVTHKLALKPGQYFIKEYIRPVYALPKKTLGGIRTKDLPDSIIPKCSVDESLLADILTKKFSDHLPLYRINEIYARDGIEIPRQLMSQWVLKIGNAIEPLYNEMMNQVINSQNIFVDETPVNVLIRGEKKARQGYMWVIAGGRDANPAYRVYDFKLNRKHENITNRLDYYTGNLHSDKYGAYEKLSAKKSINWCPCMAHVRRKFFDAQIGDLSLRDWFLRKIKYLFMFEKIGWTKSPEERLRIRQERELPIIDEMIDKAKNTLISGKILPKSKLKQALGYFYSLIPHLKNFIKDPYARIDNNVAERAIRPLAIGRKNWLFMGSPNGGKSAAVIFSLVQTCRALNINPREYLEDIMRKIQGWNFSQLEQLLPDKWVKNKAQP